MDVFDLKMMITLCAIGHTRLMDELTDDAIEAINNGEEFFKHGEL